MLVAILAYLGHLFGTLLVKVGLLFQKKTHINREKTLKNEEDLPSDTKRPFYCHPMWLAGGGIIVLGGVIQFLVLPYADLVLISTNMISGIIFNTLISIKFLNEQFLCKYDFPALGMMSIGALIIVLIAKPNERMYTKDEMVELLTSPQSIAFFIFTIVACTGSAVYLYFFLR